MASRVASNQAPASARLGSLLLTDDRVGEANGKFLKLLYLDPLLLLGLLAVSGLGLMMLYSAGQRNPDLVIGQAIRLGLGFAIMLTLAQLPPRYFRFWSPWIYLVGILLLLAVAVVGDISKGAQRWLNLGVVRFQPSEIMKLAVPMMMAWFFADKPLPPRWSHLLGGALITAIPFILIAEQPDQQERIEIEQLEKLAVGLPDAVVRQQQRAEPGRCGCLMTNLHAADHPQRLESRR